MRTSNLHSAFSVLFLGMLIIALGNTTRGADSDCDWDSGDPHKMHWPQEPDLNPTGLAIAMTIPTLADDFECSSSGPIDDIHIWGSFYRDELPDNGPDSLTFEISIYSDVPAMGDMWSKPGDLLWSQTFGPGDYSAERIHVGWADWYNRAEGSYSFQNHTYTFQYNFCIDDDPFIQEQGTIYWLVITQPRDDDAEYEFGWKTTERDLHWNDDAVFRLSHFFNWIKMRYPNMHPYNAEPLDLAFVITSEEQPTDELYDWGDAPDGAVAPGYPTMSFNNGANHVITGPWLGDDSDYPDAELNGQPEATAMGDDWDIEPLFSLGPPNDDENGVSIPPMYQGQPADIMLTVNGGGGYVDAWIDYNHNMSWEAAEKIHSLFLPDGTHTISFIVPGGAVAGPTFARFRISTEGTSYPWGPADSGEVEDYQVMIYEHCGPCDGQQFIRGDANQDNQVDDADVAFIFDYLLQGGSTPKCMDSADADDDGVVDISDATYLLHYVNGGPPPPPPFPDCGIDPTTDTLTCDQYEHCPEGDIIRNAKWFQLPDVTTNGIAIQVDNSDEIIRTIADDFECQITSLLTDVHLWCSWVNDKRGIINKIHLSIHADDPVGSAGSDPDNLFSKPAPNALWEMDFFKDRNQFQETLYYTVPEPGEYWWDPPWVSIGADRQIWRIDIDIDPNVAFLQQGTLDDPRIYWLSVHTDVNDGELGWKTRRWPDHYMDDAVMDTGANLLRTWQELRYPNGHPYHGSEQDSIDMAFCLTYTPQDYNEPTIMPVNHTQCPVAATKCPTVTTRCPPARTQCPVVFTQCPPLETQCVAITTCPPTDTTCPALSTVCPTVETQCPVYKTRCPPAETKCPLEDTQCNIEETVCPAILTKCPIYETRCPPTETECLLIDTECPAIETECPLAETRCPSEETLCPVVYTKCPPLETQCVAITMCPSEETTCPVAHTKCPIKITECPVTETRCPYESTSCPAIYTKCPAIETECPGEETRCPMEETVCPVVFTKCPSGAETQCIALPTQCPTETVCPAAETKCPMVETQCPVIETICPLVPIDTQCPVTDTACTDTICPVVTFLPDFDIICLESSGHVRTQSFSMVRQCPVVETTCPTVISKDILAKAM